MTGRSGNLAWFLTVMAITALMGSISWISLNSLIVNIDQTKQYYTSIQELRGIELSITSIENEVNNFVLTGDESYLDSYQTNLDSWKPELTILNENLDYSTDYSSQLDEIEIIINQRIKIASDLVDLKRKNQSKIDNYTDYVALVTKGKVLTDSLNLKAAALEKDISAQKDISLTQSELNAKIIIVVSIVVILLYAAIVSIGSGFKKKG